MMNNYTSFEFPAEGVRHEWEWEFERLINSPQMSEWFSSNFNVSLVCAAVYVLAIYFGQKYMEDKPKFDLRRPMILWSLFLSIFSILGAIRLSIIFFHLYRTEGVRGVICAQGFQYKGPIIRFWGPIFIMSKVVEFVDTLFIVLRKQKLIFLHWYHHATVSIYCWWMYGEKFPGGVVFMTVNIFIHSIMYTYYALRASGVKVRKPIAVAITSSQIIQMVVGSITMYLINEWRHDSDCRSTPLHIFMGSAMYVSYFVLFMDFFYKAYLTKRAPRPVAATSAPESKQPMTSTNVVGGGEKTKSNGVRRRGATST